MTGVMLRLALFSMLLAAGPAHAAGGASPPDTASERQMQAANVVTPVVRAGRLRNYLFVTVQVDLSPGADLMKTRERAHFLRDALLRAAHRADLADPARDDQLNTPAALKVYRAAAQEALGAGSVKSVSVVSVDTLRRR